MKTWMHGRYIGPVEAWRNEPALLRAIPGAKVLAQFDHLDRTLERDGKPLQAGWHEFPAADWDIDEE